MHETSLAQSLLAHVERIAAEHPDRRVALVVVRVGEFAGVEPCLLRSAFERLVVGTALAAARLELRVVPLQARCRSCGHEFHPRPSCFICPGCGARGCTIVAGEELILESIDLVSLQAPSEWPPQASEFESSMI